MKKFITSIPFQPPQKLTPIIYKPIDNSELVYDTPNALPILNAINAYADDGEEIKVYCLIPDNENCLNNFEIVSKQLNELVQSKSLICNIEKIVYSDDDNISTLLKLYGRLLKCFDDNDRLYICITYGTKPLPLVQLMALRYAYNAKKNIYIGSIVYGKVHGNIQNKDGGDIYDMTSLFYIDKLSEAFCRMSVENPEEKIAAIIFDSEEGA